MNFTMNSKVLTYCAIILSLFLAQATATAGTYHWGDFAGSDVMFLDVTENNSESTSLFAPEPGMGGPMILENTLHLDPQGFASAAENNAADLIDSTLSTVIMSGPGGSIGSIAISEFGDYSLGGLTGSSASAQVGAAFFWTVLEVDNSAVSLSTQATNLILGSGSGPNGGIYSRPGDDGTSVIWSGVANINLDSYLASQSINGAVTKLRLTFDNTLQTSAEAGSTAFIKKKSVDIVVNPNVPEPTTALLFGLGIAFVPFCRRRS